MPINGMTLNEQNAVEKILYRYKDFAKFYYYGSRVKNNYSSLSDLDLLVDGELTSNQLNSLKSELENSTELPFIVNIAIKNNLVENFYNLIKDDLIEVDFTGFC